MPDATKPLQYLAYRTCLTQDEAEDALQALGDLKIPGLRRHLFTPGKFDGRKIAKTQSFEGSYSADEPRLRNLALVASPGDINAAAVYRDGMDLLCLQRLLDHDGIDAIMLLREATRFDAAVQRWLSLESVESNEPFLVIGTANPAVAVAFAAKHPGLRACIERALDLYRNGAALALAAYSLPGVLETAWSICQRCEPA